MSTNAPRSVSTRVLLAAALALGVSACKDDADKGDAKAQTDNAKAENTAKTADGDNKAAAAPRGPTPADQIAPASQLQRGDVLGHVLLANPAGLLAEIKAQAAPQQAGMFLDEMMLRNMASAQLGERAGLAKNLDLGKPLGCALVDTTVTDAPVACVVGYKGGVDAIVTDLGQEGKQADGAGHKAHYKLQGEDLYIDDLGGNVVVSNHNEVFGKAKEYIETNMIARGGKLASDIETVAFVSEITRRYASLIEPIIKQATKTPALPTGSDNPMTKAFMRFNSKSTTDVLSRFREMEQLTFGLGFEPGGFIARWAIFPREGSTLQEESRVAAAGAMDPQLVQRFPASSFFLVGASADWTKVWSTPRVAEMRAGLIEAYAEAVKKDPAELKPDVEAFVTEMQETYGKDFGFALVKGAGGMGSMVVSMGLKPGKSGHDGWKKWAKAFTPEAVLGKDAGKDLTWSMSADAETIDGVVVDRWVIEPSAARAKKWRKEGGEQFKQLEAKLGELKLTIDRAEVDGSVLFIMTPGKSGDATKVAIAAAKGNGSLKGDAGLEALLGRTKGVSSVFAIDVKTGADWIRSILPPDKAAQIPPGLGTDLTDFFLVGSYASNGTQSGEIVVSQQLLDQIRTLAGGP